MSLWKKNGNAIVGLEQKSRYPGVKKVNVIIGKGHEYFIDCKTPSLLRHIILGATKKKICCQLNDVTSVIARHIISKMLLCEKGAFQNQCDVLLSYLLNEWEKDRNISFDSVIDSKPETDMTFSVLFKGYASECLFLNFFSIPPIPQTKYDCGPY